ncbi:MAG TPA: arylamine N-acetyltransferase [bacterium]|nr:arylamine N-acetyltransferase [bacterium]HQI47844.1 arylamine N-acetyltransferase [bacterium]HQJ64322.1 arylamine N-acetyltransferase [bacterium]
MTDPLAPPLNPWRHAAAVRHFLGHFGLAAGAPDHLQLEKVLFHFSRLPYENISKIVKLNHHFRTIERIRLPEEVMDDYVRHNLGGTCFSLSFFLQCILLHLGYSAYIVMADMGSRRNVHCALIVELQGGKFLVDPGYLLTRAMAFHRDRSSIHTSPQSGVELRYDHARERYALSTFDRQVKKLRYTFEDRSAPPAEFLQHWLDSFYQGMMHGICLTQLRAEGLVYLHDDYLQIATPEGKRKRRLKQEYPRVVSQLFAIAPEWIERAQVALAENMELEKVHGIYRPGPLGTEKGRENETR